MQLDDRMLEKDEEKLRWNYNICRNAEYKVIKRDNCPICQEEALCDWLSPYLTADVPYDVLSSMVHRNFKMIIDEDCLEEHKNHIIVHHLSDEEVRKKAASDFHLILSDPDNSKVDEKKAMDSVIRSLYGRKLLLEKEGKLGSEYLATCEELRKYVEMKLKLKKELPEESTKIDLKDLIKLDIHGQEQNTGNEKADK